jgi:SAM-dependent methyltransferase
VENDPFAGGLAFRAVGDHAREKYLEFPYTKGTRQEAQFLRAALGLPRDALVLDVACGVARHEPHLPWRVVGADLTRGLLEVARHGGHAAALVQAEARALPFCPQFDGAWSVCEGAFGLLPDDAAHVAMLKSVRACLKPGAPFLLSAMTVFGMCADEHFDLLTNTMTTPQVVTSPTGARRRFVVTTRAFAPREVISMATEAGFEVEHVWGGITGAYRRTKLTPEDPEMLVLMRNPVT